MDTWYGAAPSYSSAVVYGSYVGVPPHTYSTSERPIRLFEVEIYLVRCSDILKRSAWTIAAEINVIRTSGV